jgi:hypothetical protein
MTKTQDGRKNNGGARPGAGRPRKVEEAKLLKIISDAIPEDKFHEIWKKLGEDCLDNDPGTRTKARGQLFAYFYGQPTKRVVLEGDDENPIVITDARKHLFDQLQGND